MSSDASSERHGAIATHVCDGCGAALVLGRARASAICGYCGSRLIDREVAGAIDRLCAFRISRRTALERLRSHIADAWLAPRAIRRLARTGQLQLDALTGLLVPFVAYDARVDLRYRVEIGIDWFTHETVERDGRRQTERVQHTEWLPLQGTAVGDRSDHLECAAAGITAGEARRLLPFDLGAAVRFAPELMAGFDAELPTRRRETIDAAARRALVDSACARLQHSGLPGDHVRVIDIDHDVVLERARIVLLPVWIASYRHAGKVHRLLVHGQDGRCVGRPVISAARVSLLAASIAAAIVLLLWIARVLP